MKRTLDSNNKIVFTKELAGKIMFTIAILAVFGIGSSIPVPGINHESLKTIFSGEYMGLFDLFNLFTGGSFMNMTLFALGVSPYITASIIMQLMEMSFDNIKNMGEEGMAGRKRIARITKNLAIVLAIIQAAGITLGLVKQAIVTQNAITFVMVIALMTAGSCVLMWLGDMISSYGVGNGMSLLIFAGIVSRLPIAVKNLYSQYKADTLSAKTLAIIVICSILAIAFINFIQQGYRKIPLQFAMRMPGARTLYGGEEPHIPIKVNTAGVVPIIFSVSLLQIPATIACFIPKSKFAEIVSKYFSVTGNPGVWVYAALNMLLIIAFTYYYTDVIFKTEDISKNLARSSGMVPGIRSGEDTEKYLREVSHALCLASAIFLALIAVAPTLISYYTSVNIAFGGTSILILTGVALEFFQKIKNMAEKEERGFLVC